MRNLRYLSGCLLITACLACAAWLGYTLIPLPQLAGLFTGYGIPLPSTAQRVVDIAVNFSHPPLLIFLLTFTVLLTGIFIGKEFTRLTLRAKCLLNAAFVVVIIVPWCLELLVLRAPLHALDMVLRTLNP